MTERSSWIFKSGFGKVYDKNINWLKASKTQTDLFILDILRTIYLSVTLLYLLHKMFRYIFGFDVFLLS